ncbi:MAG TPA: CPBP family intramembrane metalloprotease [Clostridiaceae bacterium]|nr:CPBP family intramembrane metalloprotease [Clostridiaceae bacterium]
MLEMNRQRLNVHILVSIVFSLVYTVYFYVVLKLITEQDMLVSNNDITINNIGIKFIGDFFATLFVPLILTVIYRKKSADFKLRFMHIYIQYILLAIMIVLFFLHGDFTIRGYYKFFFYLVMVSFSEEFIFRGYIYNELQRHNKLLAVIVSGFFWGILHAILPGLVAGEGLKLIIVRMLSYACGGIAAEYYFIYLLEKSKSLFIPIFVHAILDYTVGVIGILTAIGTWAYLFVLDRKNHNTLKPYKS